MAAVVVLVIGVVQRKVKMVVQMVQEEEMDDVETQVEMETLGALVLMVCKG